MPRSALEKILHHSTRAQCASRCFTLVILCALFITATPALRAQEDKQADNPFLQDTPRPKPIEPVSSEELEASIRRGVDFLVETQNKDGSWGSATRTKDLNIYAPIPGAHRSYRAGTTALCVAGLIESGDERQEVMAAIERAEKWMFEDLADVRRSAPDVIYSVWGHAYGLTALKLMRDRLPDDLERFGKIDELMTKQVDMLRRYEVVDGGWGYYDFNAQTQKPSGSSSSFTTATVLVALHHAKEVGIEVPEKLIARATASIDRQQKPDFTYAYGEYLKDQPMRGINRPSGSLGRSQACNIALRMWGDEQITDKVLNVWLDRLYARNGWLDMGRKRPRPHESWDGVAGYFYYYGHYYAAYCIDALPQDDRPYFQDHLARIIMDKQEKDGSWWDYPLYNYHQPYGTGYALSTLVRCRKAR